MELDHRRKRKSIGRPYSSSSPSSSSSSFSNTHLYFSARSLFLFFIFFFVIISFSNRFYLIAPPYNFRFRRSSSSFSLLYSSSSSSSATTRSVLDSFNPTETFLSSSLTIQHRIILPDYLLLIVAGNDTYWNQNLRCVYRHPTILDDDDALFQPVISTDLYDELRSIVRCPIPPANYSLDAVDLRRRGETVDRNRNQEVSPATTTTTYSWDNLAYEAYLDEDDSVIVFAKGLKLRPHKIHDPTRIRCHFGSENSDSDDEFAITTDAISAAQEVFRCPLPPGIPEGENGIRVTVSNSILNRGNPTGRPVPSIAVIQTRNRTTSPEKKKHVLCACTMLWNQASFIKEWIMYHAWLGVERWFIYDNNSDDEISDVVAALNRRGFNVTRKPWPWMKSQEAGFSHCAVAAKPECKWVGFFDVDEFFNLKNKSQNSLKSLVSKFSDDDENNNVGEIRTACRSFGPSGLTARPRRGVTVGYTCRLRGNERHKSIVRPEMVEQSLMNVVHHFAMKEGVRFVELKDHNEGVINHYKYQVWESFKDKFRRRVSTYVADWGDRRNTGSKDRAPGLGTVAREPEDWRERFCEVWDTKLRDFVLANFVDPKTMTLPWET